MGTNQKLVLENSTLDEDEDDGDRGAAAQEER